MQLIHKVRFACLSGTALEFFEFQIFIMLMPYLAAHFFAPATQNNQPYFAVYLVFGVAFIARPLGSILLGYVGDYYGRRSALLMAMWIMASATLLIGLLPGWGTVGVLATGLLAFCRIMQGLSLGGEYACGFVFLFEHTHQPRCRDLIWTDMGGCIGSALAALLSSLTVWLFSAAELQAYAWRFPFFAAVLLALCGIYIRSSMTDPHNHTLLISHNRKRKRVQYYREVLAVWPTLLLASLACVPNGIFWYLQLILVPQQILPMSVSMLMYFSLTNLASIPLGAWLADRCGSYRVWVLSVIALTANFIFIVSSHQVAWQMAAFFLQATFLAINMGPRVYILNESFPMAIRAIGCSFTYSAANVFGGLTPFAALWLFNHYHNFHGLIFSLIGIALLAVISMVLLYSNNHKQIRVMESNTPSALPSWF